MKIISKLKSWRLLIFVGAFLVGIVVLSWKLGFERELLLAACVVIIIFGLPIAIFFPTLGKRPPS